MKKLLILLFSLVLSGCLTITVRQDFPELSPSLKTSCPEKLKDTPENTDKLSTVISIVDENYATYHICRAKVDSLIEWYTVQKKIYEGVK